MTEIGTEKRVDELSKRVDQGFAEVHREMDQRFDGVEGDVRQVRSEVTALREDMKSGFERIDAKFDSLNRTIILILGGAVGTLVGAAVAAMLSGLS